MSTIDRRDPRHAPVARERLDWRSLGERLASARAAAARALAPEPEDARRILRARARALARVPAPAPAEERLELLEFQLAQERYAIGLRQVREVVRLDHLCPLPCVPPFVLGVVSLRGVMVSVLDLKRFFDLPVRALAERDWLLLLESGAMRFGVLADAVHGISTIPLAAIQRPALAQLGDPRERYVLGVTAAHTVVLDAEALLTDPRLIVNEQVATAMPAPRQGGVSP